MTVPLASCSNNDANIVNIHEQTQTPNDIADQADLLVNSGDIGKVILADVSTITVPVSEFYFTNSDGVVTLYPNKNLPKNNEGTVIVTITDKSSNEATSGNTLNEIIPKIYSDVLNSYNEDEQASIKNKIIDEIIQSNPSLAQYISEELGDKARSYEKISGLDLYNGNLGNSGILDTRLLIMPNVIAYQVQGENPENSKFVISSSLYTPSSNSASVIKDGSELLDGEYSSFSKMIYGEYGNDISDEAYRDIVYAVVNSPENAVEFEAVLDQMDFNEIINTANINDLNRTLDENTDKEMLGIFLPSVTTLRTAANNADVKSGNRDGIVYQISPAAVVDGQNDLSVSIVDNTNEDGLMKDGQVFKLADVLQFYNSPDGNGRFAIVSNGKLYLNNDVNYVGEFATQILQQVVFANLDIFASEYEDNNGIYKYGVFDVDKNYDTEGKSIDDILEHSTINIDRLMSYSFVDENGISKFENGVKLNLPQFNYRINECDALKDGNSSIVNPPDEPSIPDDEPSIPDDEPSIPDDEPSIPDDEPSIPDDEPSIPDDEPSIPDDEPSIPDDEPSIPDDPDDSDCPTIPDEDPTHEEEPTIPDDNPSKPDDDPSIKPSEGGSEVDPIDPSDPDGSSDIEDPSQDPSCDDSEIENPSHEDEPSIPGSSETPDDKPCDDPQIETPIKEDEPNLLSASVHSSDSSKSTKTTLASQLTSFVLSKMGNGQKDKINSVDTYI